MNKELKIYKKEIERIRKEIQEHSSYIEYLDPGIKKLKKPITFTIKIKGTIGD